MISGPKNGRHKLPDWRSYQAYLKKRSRAKRLPRLLFRIFPAIIIIASLTYVMADNYILDSAPTDNPDVKANTGGCYPALNDKANLVSFLDSKSFVNIEKKDFSFRTENNPVEDNQVVIKTSIDTRLQNYLLKRLDKDNSLYIAIVAMEPDTGRIVSMVSYDKKKQSSNTCIEKRFPAASVFKIVTAAAAIEKCGFTGDSVLKYSGGKHTLYRSQLKRKTKRKTENISFKDSFAQSINPVFGKIGIHNLGKSNLEHYAHSFGFNRDIGFEIPVLKSVLSLKNEPYHWAEIACGFNRETAITPLHGAMIVSAVLNQGWIVEPTLIDAVFDENERELYKSRLSIFSQAMLPKTSNALKLFMQTTISSGTSRKTFKHYYRDPVLSTLNLGGKTGSINDAKDNIKYDWFVGFAEEKDGDRSLAVSVLVAHYRYIGIRAGNYAKMLIKHYFENVEERKEKLICSGKKEKQYAGF